MNILGLDISVRSLGWALGDGTPEGTHFGTEDFSNYDKDLGKLFSNYEGWLNGILYDNSSIELLSFENSYNNMRGISGYMLTNLNGITHKLAYEFSLPRLAYAPPTIKKFVTGSGRASKEEMVESIQQRGFKVGNNDEADAVGVLLLGKERYESGHE